jgi:hypothetical protein
MWLFYFFTFFKVFVTSIICLHAYCVCIYIYSFWLIFYQGVPNAGMNEVVDNVSNRDGNTYLARVAYDLSFFVSYTHTHTLHPFLFLSVFSSSSSSSSFFFQSMLFWKLIVYEQEWQSNVSSSIFILPLPLPTPSKWYIYIYVFKRFGSASCCSMWLLVW